MTDEEMKKMVYNQCKEAIWHVLFIFGLIWIVIQGIKLSIRWFGG